MIKSKPTQTNGKPKEFTKLPLTRENQHGYYETVFVQFPKTFVHFCVAARGYLVILNFKTT